MDNSYSPKEGVSWTYKQFGGYAPMFGYIGPFGLMINNELRNGSAHSYPPPALMHGSGRPWIWLSA